MTDQPHGDDATSSREPMTAEQAELRVRQHAEMFSNRVGKNFKHLRKWAARENTDAWRLYDRDIPEIPLTIDLYAGFAQVSDYRREDEVAALPDWFDAMMDAFSARTAIPAERIYVKSRWVQSRTERYQRVSDVSELVEVNEHGLKFQVNLSDYVDVGLFLDHRITRGMVRQRAKGMNVLNLFAYTGSFSVHAAAGGAARTTAVDLSNTYTNWARENLSRNGFGEPAHRVLRADVFQYLRETAPHDGPFDLIILDPPTFSNSKKTSSSFDVQRDHVLLLRLCLRVLKSTGAVIFSNNRKGFRLDIDEAGLIIDDITAKTIPEDFGHRIPHKCWVIRPD